MSVSGPSPLGTLMVQRVEAALGVTGAQQANVATGARPDAVSQPGQTDKTDPAKNPPPKGQDNPHKAEQQGGRQAGLTSLTRNDPEIARLLAARNAPMTSYTASAPTTLGLAAKTILALLQQLPDARPAVPGRAPLLGHAPGQGGAPAAGATSAGTAANVGTGAAASSTLDPRAVEAVTARGTGPGAGHAARSGTPSSSTGTAGASSLPGAQASTTTGPAGTSGQTPAFMPGGGVTPTTGAQPIGMAGQLAQALSHALQGSGLFYESHLRDLAFGQRTAQQLGSEPQAQASGQNRSPASEAPGARGQADSTGTGGSTQPASQTSAGQPTAGGQPGAGAAPQTSATAQLPAPPTTPPTAHAGSQLAGALMGLDPSTHAIVRQQLETLANQSFAWQGEAWPGADLEWEVSRREGQNTEDADHWATRLTVRLPGLGEVKARLSLSGNQLVMHLAAPDSAPVMADHTELLRQRLGAQGMQLSQLTISRDENETQRGGSL